MTFAVRRLRRFVWASTRSVREKILARLRAHVARALAENFSQLTEHVDNLTRMGAGLASEIRAAEQRHQQAEARHLEAQMRAQATEEQYRDTIVRCGQTLADYQQKLGDYHQAVSESNLLAEGVIREMVRLQQQVDELAEAVDLVNDTIRPESSIAPVTLKYRAAA